MRLCGQHIKFLHAFALLQLSRERGTMIYYSDIAYLFLSSFCIKFSHFFIFPFSNCSCQEFQTACYSKSLQNFAS